MWILRKRQSVCFPPPYVNSQLTHVVEEKLSDEDEESIFIPFSIPQKLPKTFYKQSDPDWQEFVRMSNDEKRSKAVRGTANFGE